MESIVIFLKSKEFLYRYFAVMFFIASFRYTEYQLYLLLISGLTLGYYYGLYNDIIWRPKGTLSEATPYRAHQLWVHIVCGCIASLATYFLFSFIGNYGVPVAVDRSGLNILVLFVIAVLGYVGLLPRILWYLSYATFDKKP